MKPSKFDRSRLLAEACAFFAAFWTAIDCRADAGGLLLRPLASGAAQYERMEWEIQGVENVANPYDPDGLRLDVEITGPDRRTVQVPAFYFQAYDWESLGDGARRREWYYPWGLPGWRARFAPTIPGAYAARAVAVSATGTLTSAPAPFVCTAGTGCGYIRVSRADARFLERSTGEPFFPIGQNLAFIGPGQHVTPSKVDGIFQRLAENGANFLRLWAGCDDWALALESRKSAFGRSWNWQPPFSRLPEAGAADRLFLHLDAARSSVAIDPSHPVALRPSTRYVFAGRVRLTGGTLRCESGALPAQRLAEASAPPAWRSFQVAFQTGPAERWLGIPKLRLEGPGEAWIDALSLRAADVAGPELLWEAEVNRPLRGVYNLLDAFQLDQVVVSAERQGLALQLCLLARDLYLRHLKDPTSAEYTAAVADARKLVRYAVARWGYSTAVAAWEYWNEMDPGLPTDRFYTELGMCLDSLDVARHLRTTSTWGPSPKDGRHPQLDLADVHFYLRPADRGRLRDEVDAVLDRARWLRDNAPGRPAHLGEFGLADDRWRLTDEMRRSPELADVHNALWASALSGTAGTALFWWWERLDQRDAYSRYRPLSRFISDLPWNGGQVKSVAVSVTPAALVPVALRAGPRAWLWIFDPQAAWHKVALEKVAPPTHARAVVTLEGFTEGSYRVEWWDTRKGERIRETSTASSQGVLRFETPSFEKDIAARLQP